MDESNAMAAYATIRLMGAALDPAVVTNALALEPSKAHRAGDVSERNPQVVYRSGFWSISSEGRVGGADLGDHLSWLLNLFDGRDRVLDELRRREIEGADAFCYWVSKWGHGGPSIEPEVLQRLSKLRFALTIDFYDGSDGEVEEPYSADDVVQS